jgi:type II secretory pathway pseudopilin PulG
MSPRSCERGLIAFKTGCAAADMPHMRSLLARAWRRAHSPVRDDSGFSLIEAVVALSVATVAFLALAVGSMTAIRASLVGRANQQAADFMTRQLESVRVLDFASVANVTSDLAGDTALSNCSGSPCIDPGTGTKEKIYVGTGTGGAITQHIQTITGASLGGATNNVTYTVRTYVTSPADTYTGKYHRVTVFVSWRVLGVTRTRTTSTMIAYSLKGLPLPVFTLATKTATTVSVNPGAEVAYGFKLTNQGAPDRFNLARSDTDTWTWVFDNGDGVFDPSTDTTLVTDTNADGIIDTGRMNPNGYVVFWVYRTAGSTASSTVTTWSATSVGQPTAATAVETAATTTNVVIGVITATPTPTSTSPTPTPSPTPSADCNSLATIPAASAASSYSLVSRTLHNGSVAGATTTKPLMVMDTTAPFGASLASYSTDVDPAQPGRVMQAGGTATTGSTSQTADWRFTMGTLKGFSGTAQLTFWAGPLSGNTAASLSLTAYIYSYKTSTGVRTTLGTMSFTANPNACTGLQKFVGTAPISVANNALSKTDQVGVRIVSGGPTTVRLGYDVTSVYPATLVLPQK